MNQLEEQFYEKDFYFSYSSINKLRYDPSLFYSYYVLGEREEKLESYLVDGRVLHCLLLQPEEFDNQFIIAPGKTPTPNTKKILDRLFAETENPNKDLTTYQDEILKYLIEYNLHQSLKTDEQRINKIIDADSTTYWEYRCKVNDKITVIDEDTYNRMLAAVDICKENEQVKEIFSLKDDEEFDEYKVYNEHYLQYDLKGKNYGLKGIIDKFVVNHKEKSIHVYDLKTTGKVNKEFPETIEFYSYWMQAAIYCLLASKFVQENADTQYSIRFSFVVLDKLNQVCIFDISNNTLNEWLERLVQEFNRLDYHYNERDFKLPFELRTGRVTL